MISTIIFLFRVAIILNVIIAKKIECPFPNSRSLVKERCNMQLKTKAAGHSQVCNVKQKYVEKKTLHPLDVHKSYVCCNFERMFTINVSSNISYKSNRSNTSSNIISHLSHISSNISAIFKYH